MEKQARYNAAMQFRLLAILLGLLPALCAAQPLLVRIGHAAPRSGPLAAQGQESEHGARLALEELQARGVSIGGRSLVFELVGEDDQASASGAAQAARRLVDAGVKGVVGHLNSNASMSALKLYAQAGVPMISPSSTSPLLSHQGFPQFFRSIASDARQAEVLAAFLRAQPGRRVAVLDDRTAYGEGLALGVEQALHASGKKRLLRQFTTSQTVDFTALIAKLKPFGPDWVVYAGTEQQGARLLQQMRQAGLSASFLSGDGACNEAFIQIAREAMSEKVFCARAGLPLAQLADADFARRFEARFGRPPQDRAPQAYAAAAALVQAMLAARSVEPARYLPALRGLRMKSVEGELSFEPNGDMHAAPLSLYRFKAGAWVPAKD